MQVSLTIFRLVTWPHRAHAERDRAGAVVRRAGGPGLNYVVEPY
jgi:hypothetical protein